MKTITKMELKSGMVLAEDINVQGRCLYPAGTKIDNVTIEKLNRYSVLCVTVMEDIDLASTHYERVRLEENFKAFEKTYSDVLMRFKTQMRQFILSGVMIPDEILLGFFEELYVYIPAGGVLLDYLYNMMPNEDELTYTHSLNSALLAGAFADWLSMNDYDRKLLILCGFYYDIGKLQLPYNILWKPDKLTDEEYALVKRHPAIGYMLVCNVDLDDNVKSTVIQHHERLDGSGYPYHMKGKYINLFARYIAIIDTYIAMASPRAYRSALTPLQILGHFEKNMEKYDVELLLPIMKRIADAQLNSHIQLNDGSIWEVFIIHPQNFSRPILKNKSNDFLDLMARPDMEIVKNV